MPRHLFFVLATLAVAPGYASTATPTACPPLKVRLGGPTPDRPRQGYDAVDHSRFDELLHRFVDCQGMVCYQAWKADADAVAQLHHYLCELGRVDTQAPATAAAMLAYYINAYNALTIWGILQDYPIPSIQVLNRKGACYRIFDDLELWVGGAYLSLNGIENNVLRPMKEPRIHFALVCAAKGCPRLRNEAYVACRLDSQLTDNARDFFASRRRFHLCRLTRTVWLSPLLKWYGKDFGPDECAILDAILPYLPCGDGEWLQQHDGWRVKYRGYDWGLNDRCPTVSVKVRGLGYSTFARMGSLLRPAMEVFRSGK